MRGAPRRRRRRLGVKESGRKREVLGINGAGNSELWEARRKGVHRWRLKRVWGSEERELEEGLKRG